MAKISYAVLSSENLKHKKLKLEQIEAVLDITALERIR